MKRYILIALLCISSIGFSQASLDWKTDFETAKTIAKSANKPILMYFTGSDWCPPCKHLKQDFFDSDEFRSKSKEVVLLLVDIPYRVDVISKEQLKKNKELEKKFNTKRSYPLIVGLTASGREISRFSAYSSLRDPSIHFRFLDNLLRF